MKHLVIGSAGLVGRYLTSHIIAEGEQVLTFDILNNEKEDLRIRHEKGSYLYSLIEQADMVYFLAFDVGGCKYLSKNQYSLDYISNNILIMQNTFSLLKDKPFIFTSTQLVNTPGAYGALKVIGEHYTNSLNGIFVRLWNVYGFEIPCIKSHVICDFIYQALTKQKIVMLSDGSEDRQFLHGSDCAKALYQIAKNYDKIDSSKQLHISSGKWIKIIDLANLIALLIPGTIVESGNISGHVIKAEPSKDIKEYFDIELIGLQDGLSKLIEEYKSHIFEGAFLE
jgi:nucleoside-diphosphate-sugar epimerase